MPPKNCVFRNSITNITNLHIKTKKNRQALYSAISSKYLQKLFIHLCPRVLKGHGAVKDKVVGS